MSNRQDLLAEFPNRAALCKTLDDFIGLGLDSAQALMAVEAAALFGRDGKDLQLLASRGLPGEESTVLAWGRCLNSMVAETGKPIVVDKHHPDKHFFCALKGEEIKALVAVPMVSRGRIIGTLTAATREAVVFEPCDVHILETLGKQLGMAMENAMLHTKQKAIKAQLQESEKQYRALFERTNDIIWIEDQEGHIISANNACAKIMETDHEVLMQKNIRAFIPEGGVKAAIAARQNLLDGKAAEEPYDQTIISSTGQKKVLKVTTNRLRVANLLCFQHIAKDITEERKMQENLRFYLQQITRAQEEERARISRELHDSTAQSLIAVLHQLEKFLNGTPSLQVIDYRNLCSITEQIKGTLQEVRHFSRNLRPSILDDLGLLPALEWFTEELRRTQGLITTFRVVGDEIRLLPEVEVTLFRLVQEALRNVIRHADATHAFVCFTFYKDNIMLTIQDNGKGFSVPTTYSELPRQGKLGLTGMHERVRLIGGTLTINSLLGKGTTIKISAPYDTVTPYEY